MARLRPGRRVMGPTKAALAEFDRLTRPNDQPCGSRATFPDGVHECALDDSHVDRGVWHENEALDHRWSIEMGDDGEPLQGMVKEG